MMSYSDSEDEGLFDNNARDKLVEKFSQNPEFRDVGKEEIEEITKQEISALKSQNWEIIPVSDERDIFDAYATRDNDRIKSLLENNPSLINTTDANKKTLLYHCLSNSDWSTVRILLVYGGFNQLFPTINEVIKNKPARERDLYFADAETGDLYNTEFFMAIKGAVQDIADKDNSCYTFEQIEHILDDMPLHRIPRRFIETYKKTALVKMTARILPAKNILKWLSELVKLYKFSNDMLSGEELNVILYKMNSVEIFNEAYEFNLMNDLKFKYSNFSRMEEWKTQFSKHTAFIALHQALSTKTQNDALKSVKSIFVSMCKELSNNCSKYTIKKWITVFVSTKRSHDDLLKGNDKLGFFKNKLVNNTDVFYGLLKQLLELSENDLIKRYAEFQSYLQSQEELVHAPKPGRKITKGEKSLAEAFKKVVLSVVKFSDDNGINIWVATSNCHSAVMKIEQFINHYNSQAENEQALLPTYKNCWKSETSDFSDSPFVNHDCSKIILEEILPQSSSNSDCQSRFTTFSKAEIWEDNVADICFEIELDSDDMIFPHEDRDHTDSKNEAELRDYNELFQITEEKHGPRWC